MRFQHANQPGLTLLRMPTCAKALTTVVETHHSELQELEAEVHVIELDVSSAENFLAASQPSVLREPPESMPG